MEHDKIYKGYEIVAMVATAKFNKKDMLVEQSTGNRFLWSDVGYFYSEDDSKKKEIGCSYFLDPDTTFEIVPAVKPIRFVDIFATKYDGKVLVVHKEIDKLKRTDIEWATDDDYVIETFETFKKGEPMYLTALMCVICRLVPDDVFRKICMEGLWFCE